MDLKEQTKAPAETETRTGSYVGNPGSKAGAAPVERAPRPIEDGVDIGHVHLRASDLGKIKDFYVGILGFDVVVEAPTMLFMSAGGYHHHLGFNTWESKGGAPTNPSWYHNLKAHPHVTVEVDGEKFAAHASVVDEDEYERLYLHHATRNPAFHDYRTKTTRKIPVVLLERV